MSFADLALLGSRNVGFSPLDISNIQFWFDASDSSTITKDGSDRISQWDDKSGNGFDLLQATAGNQPLLEAAGQNGLDVVDFAGDRFMQTVSFTAISQPNTIVGTCLFPVNDSENRKIFSGIVGTSRHQFFKETVADDWNMFAGTTLQGTKTGVANTWKEFFTLWKTTSSILEIDGASVASGDVGSQTLTGLTVAAQHDGSEQFGDNKVGEIIGYDKEVSGTEKTDLMAYLTRWGVWEA